MGHFLDYLRMVYRINTESTEHTEEEKDPLTNGVIGAAVEVHRYLGLGLL